MLPIVEKSHCMYCSATLYCYIAWLAAHIYSKQQELMREDSNNLVVTNNI